MQPFWPRGRRVCFSGVNDPAHDSYYIFESLDSYFFSFCSYFFVYYLLAGFVGSGVCLSCSSLLFKKFLSRSTASKNTHIHIMQLYAVNTPNLLQVFVDSFCSPELNSHLDIFHFALCVLCTTILYCVMNLCVFLGCYVVFMYHPAGHFGDLEPYR